MLSTIFIAIIYIITKISQQCLFFQLLKDCDTQILLFKYYLNFKNKK